MAAYYFRLGRPRVVLMLAAAVGLWNAGCCMVVGMVGMGLAGGAGTGYVFAKGKVEQTYPVAFVDVWSAAHAALADLGFEIEKENMKRGVIIGRTSERARVRLYVKEQHVKYATDGPRTRIAVRVGCFGNRAVSERIVRQVALRLTPPVPVESQGASTPSPVAPAPNQSREKN